MSSCCESIDVFNSKQDDELAEQAVVDFTCKLENPNVIDNSGFIQNVVQGTDTQSREIGNVLPMDFNYVDGNHNCDNAFSYSQMDRAEDFATKRVFVLDTVSRINSRIPEPCPLSGADKLDTGNFYVGLQGSSIPRPASPDHCQLDCAHPEFSSNDESFDKVSDADESTSKGSTSTSSDIAEDDVSFDGLRSNPCVDGWEVGSRDLATIFYPDYLVYHDIYSVDSVLTFSSSSLEIKGSNAKGNLETFCFQWGIGDLVDIESQWLGRYDTAMVYIHLCSKNAAKTEHTHGNSDIEELKLAVVESNWYEKQEAIMALDDRYKTLWNTVLDTDMGKDELGQLTEPLPKRYFPNFDEPFEDVVYPKGDSDAVSISKRDVDLLQPDTFVNDTIIDFYIKYLKNNIQPDERHRFHFFNSFFFRKLADLDKDPSSAFEGRAAFQRVRKWTRKVNLFEKDYVFIPVNFNYHWSLIVICHPGEVATFQDDDVEKSLKVPCILHMDSIRGSHTGLKGLVQSYLWEEWKEKQKETSEDISLRFSNLRFLSLELPQQQNTYDCGLFLLHYVELFLEDAPASFSPFKITKFSKFLNMDWFPPAEASLKRVIIQRLIYDLLDICSADASPASGSGKHCSSNCPKNNYDHETAVEFLSGRCSPLNFHHGNVPNSQAVEGIEMTHLPTSSLKSSQYVNESGLVLGELFEPGAAAGSFFDASYQEFDQTIPLNGFSSAMSSVEEVEASRQLAYPSMETGFQQSAGTTLEGCAFPYSSRDYAVGASWNEEIPVNQAEHGDINLPQETSSDSGNSLEELNAKAQVKEDVSLKEEIDDGSSPLTENMECSTECLTSAPHDMVDVINSQCHTLILDDHANRDAHTSFQNNLDGISHQNHNMLETGNKTCANLRSIDDDSMSELDEQPSAKRMRLNPPEGDGFAGTLPNDLHL